MTLIVARRLRKSVRVCCDSKATDEQGVRSGYLTGALKAVILDRQTCVAFAGKAVPAFDAVRRLDARRRLATHQTLDPEEAVKLLSGASAASGGRTHFLVASIALPTIVGLRGVEVDRGDQQWIGDRDAFEAFQRHFHEPTGMAQRATTISAEEEEQQAEMARRRAQIPRSEHTLFKLGLDVDTANDYYDWGRVTDALCDVIADPGVASVDELPVAAVGDEEGFRYLPLMSQFGGPEQQLPPGVETPIQFGKPAAAGGFGYSILAPDSGIGAIGVYFVQGALGALFHPIAADEPILYSRLDQAAFVAAVERDYGFCLHGFGVR